MLNLREVTEFHQDIIDRYIERSALGWLWLKSNERAVQGDLWSHLGPSLGSKREGWLVHSELQGLHFVPLPLDSSSTKPSVFQLLDILVSSRTVFLGISPLPRESALTVSAQNQYQIQFVDGVCAEPRRMEGDDRDRRRRGWWNSVLSIFVECMP